MAYGIQNYDGTKNPIDSSYPHGDIKDDTGANDGTRNNRKSNADIQQFFAKLLRLASETPNGLPDNEYSGFQYVTALKYILGSFKKFYELDTVSAGILPSGDYNSLTVVKPTCGSGCFVTLGEPTSSYIGKQTIANYSAYTVQLVALSGGVTINGAGSSYNLLAGEYMELEYNAGGTNWVVKTFNLLEP